MQLDKLRINQLPADGWEWYRAYLAVLDAYDLEGYLDLLSEDVTIQFNNEEPMIGKEVARAGLAQFWGSVTAMGFSLVHVPLNIYGDAHHLAMEALNLYVRGGTSIPVRATAWTDRRADGLVTAVRLYQDVSPVYSAAATA